MVKFINHTLFNPFSDYVSYRLFTASSKFAVLNLKTNIMTFSKTTSTLILALLISLTSLAQSTQFKMDRNLGFKETSKEQTVKVKISEKTSTLTLEILCSVKKGAVTVEIFNPAGTKQGEFSVEGVESEKDSSLFSILNDGVSGQIKKIINDPELGDWKIKFIPKNATGRVQFHSNQIMYN